MNTETADVPAPRPADSREVSEASAATSSALHSPPGCPGTAISKQVDAERSEDAAAVGGASAAAAAIDWVRCRAASCTWLTAAWSRLLATNAAAPSESSRRLQGGERQGCADCRLQHSRPETSGCWHSCPELQLLPRPSPTPAHQLPSTHALEHELHHARYELPLERGRPLLALREQGGHVAAACQLLQAEQVEAQLLGVRVVLQQQRARRGDRAGG